MNQTYTTKTEHGQAAAWSHTHDRRCRLDTHRRVELGAVDARQRNGLVVKHVRCPTLDRVAGGLLVLPGTEGLQ